MPERVDRRATSAAAGWRAGRGGRADPRPSSVVYGAGLENRPDLVARLAARAHAARLHPPTTLRRVRDPALLGASLRAAGLAYPQTLAAADARRADARAAGCASRCAAAAAAACASGAAARCSPATSSCRSASAASPCSAAAVADGRSAVVLGVSEQLIGRRALGARGCTWCGNVVAAAAAGRRASGARSTPPRAICAHLAAAFGLRGLFGVDLVWDGERAWVVEVNPRPTASLETIEAAHGVRSFAAHLRRVRRARSPAAPGRDHGRAAGKAVLFATRGRCGSGHERLAGPRHPRRAASRRARSRAGHPVCTVVATGGDPARRCWPSSRRGPPRCAPSSSARVRLGAGERVDLRRLRLRVRRHHGRRRRRGCGA